MQENDLSGSEYEEHDGVERIGEPHAFVPQRIGTPKEINDEAYCFEISERVPCCAYGSCDAAPCRTCRSCGSANARCEASVLSVVRIVSGILTGLIVLFGYSVLFFGMFLFVYRVLRCTGFLSLSYFLLGLGLLFFGMFLLIHSVLFHSGILRCCCCLLCVSVFSAFSGFGRGLCVLLTLIVGRRDRSRGGAAVRGFGFRSCVHVLGFILRTQRLRIVKHHWHPSCHAPLLSGSYSVNRLRNSSRAGWTNACLNKRLMTAEGGLSAVYRPCGQGNAVSDLSVCDHALHCCGRYPTQAGKFPIGIFNVFGIAAGNRDSRNGDVIA